MKSLLLSCICLACPMGCSPATPAQRPGVESSIADTSAAGVRVPPPEPNSTAIACHEDEPGPRLLISGEVRDENDRPIAGAVVTTYNADAAGLYNPRTSKTRAPRIRAVVQADANGRFQVLTVRPGPYPDADEPAHVHFEASAPGYHIGYSAIWFAGDPLITPAKVVAARKYERSHPRDFTATLAVEKRGDGLQFVRHRIKLEEN